MKSLRGQPGVCGYTRYYNKLRLVSKAPLEGVRDRFPGWQEGPANWCKIAALLRCEMTP